MSWAQSGPLAFQGTLGTALSITAFWERPVRVRSCGVGWGQKGVPGSQQGCAQGSRTHPPVVCTRQRGGCNLGSGDQSCSPPGGIRLGDVPFLSHPSRGGWDASVTREDCRRSQLESGAGGGLGQVWGRVPKGIGCGSWGKAARGNFQS